VIRAHQPGSEPSSQGASSDPGEGSLARRLNGRQLYVRRAVDSEGEVPGHPRSTTATGGALKLMRKLLKKHGVTPATPPAISALEKKFDQLTAVADAP
jgi:hypothetical protein